MKKPEPTITKLEFVCDFHERLQGDEVPFRVLLADLPTDTENLVLIPTWGYEGLESACVYRKTVTPNANYESELRQYQVYNDQRAEQQRARHAQDLKRLEDARARLNKEIDAKIRKLKKNKNKETP